MTALLCTDAWRLDIVSHTDRLVEAAMDELGDGNEARWLVHNVMLNAMRDMTEPATRRTLDSALGRALREHAEAA